MAAFFAKRVRLAGGDRRRVGDGEDNGGADDEREPGGREAGEDGDESDGDVFGGWSLGAGLYLFRFDPARLAETVYDS